MKTQRKPGATRKLLTPFIALTLAASACGGSGDANSAAQASVSVGSVESGCAEAINLARLVNGGSFPSMTNDDMRQLADGAESLQGTFSGQAAEVDEYISLVSDVVSNTAETADDQGDPNAAQILALLDFEMAGRADDFERLSPAANAYFGEQCGSAYADATTASSAVGRSDVADAGTTEPGESSESTVNADPDESTIDEPTDPDAPLTSEPTLIVDDGSVDSTATYFGIDMIVGEIWRTNLTPLAAISDDTEIGEQPITLIEIRLSSNGASLSLSPRSFGFVADGIRTNASSAILSSGADWDLRVGAQESKSGYLVFEGDFDPIEGTMLQWSTGELAEANAPLGIGEWKAQYPFLLNTTSETVPGQVVATPFDCLFSYEIEARDALAAVDIVPFGNFERSVAGERFIVIDVAFTMVSTDSEDGVCRAAETFFPNDAGIRLVLDNGDALATFGPPPDLVRLGATETAPHYFTVPANTTSFSLVDHADTVIAEWTDFELPEL